jgi:hypothetical protein
MALIEIQLRRGELPTQGLESVKGDHIKRENVLL